MIEQVADYFRSIVGQKTESDLGKITALMIQRYALSIGDDNPLYYDKEFAQKHGYADIITPPNLLISIVDYGVGVEEEKLRRDGTPKDSFLPFEGIRVMGGGEETFFFSPVVAGTHVTLTTEVTDTYTKQGKKGLIAFLVSKNTYRDLDGNVLCVSNRTIIAR